MSPMLTTIYAPIMDDEARRRANRKVLALLCAAAVLAVALPLIAVLWR